MSNRVMGRKAIEGSTTGKATMKQSCEGVRRARMFVPAVALLVGVSGLAGSVWGAQPERISSPPGQPGAPVQPLPPEVDRSPDAEMRDIKPPAEEAKEAAAPVIPDEEDVPYKVSRFLLEYRSEHPDRPPIDELLGATVTLGVTEQGFVSPRAGLAETRVRLADVVEGPGMVFRRSALSEVAKAIVGELNERGIIGVFVQFHPEDVEDGTGVDLRPGGTGDLRLIVWTGVVQDVRTIASGERLESRIALDSSLRVNTPDRVLERVRRQSPVQPGSLLQNRVLDEYVFRLNRHPGRRVDIAVAPGDKPEQVVVDYLVAELKPWSVYGQLSNTGTETTSEWRQRFGFVHNQLSGHDDILRLDYITGGFDASHALLGSYEFPLASDVLKARVYGSFGTFTASDVGLAAEEFEGTNYGLGGELTWNVYQYREFFLDLVGGARWSNVEIENSLLGSSGNTDFFLPYIGARVERATDASLLFGGVTLEFQLPDVANTDEAELTDLGRLDIDDEWVTLKYDAGFSFYLEPLIEPRGYAGDPSEQRFKTLAHEIALQVRGQLVLDDKRVIPNEQEVAGGLFTVRGYPESAVAGDSAVIVSAEYRFHVPRALGVGQPGTWQGRELDWFGSSFRYQPAQPYGRTDWDLILKAFVDHAQTTNNNSRPGEFNASLTGTGVGLELQWKRNASFRVDWGIALEGTDEPDGVESGDNRFHFLLTLLY